ncbi:hypothetical protein AgCh_026103 [Apium graveolens]
MEIEVKVTGTGTEKLFEISMQPELLEKIRLCQEKMMNEGREPINRYEINTEKDDKGIMRMRVIHHELKLMVEGISDIYSLPPEVTFKNGKCKTGGMIPRKGDARTSMLSLPNQERKADDHCYLLEAIWIDLNLNKDAIMKLGKAKEVADTLKDEVVERKMLGSAVVQRTKDMIDLIRGRLVVAQDGHDMKG